MPGGHSLGDKDATSKVPQVAWDRLSSRKTAANDHPHCLYRAILAMPDGQKEPVDVYASPNPQLEVLAMRELDGLTGVPRAHGVTEPSPEALVVDSYLGFTLRACLVAGEGRTCLAALLQVCTILQRMHSMGVTHGDLTVQNILVNVHKGELKVCLVGFHSARRYATQEDVKADERQMTSLAAVTASSLSEDSARGLHKRRWQLLRHTDQHLTLVETAMVVCAVLHDHHVNVVR